MNIIAKIILLFSISGMLSACAPPPIYQATGTGSTAKMKIEVPNEYQADFSLYTFVDTEDSKSERRLVYGVNGVTPQFNTNVKIEANKEMYYYIRYSINGDSYCEQNFRFTLKSGGEYELLIGTKTEKKSLLSELIFGAKTTCRVALAEETCGRLVPVKIVSY
jgi:hypothetical protein